MSDILYAYRGRPLLLALIISDIFFIGWVSDLHVILLKLHLIFFLFAHVFSKIVVAAPRLEPRSSRLPAWHARSVLLCSSWQSRWFSRFKSFKMPTDRKKSCQIVYLNLRNDLHCLVLCYSWFYLTWGPKCLFSCSWSDLKPFSPPKFD